MTWPSAGLDRVRQLRVMGAALAGVGVVERVLDAPFDDVWTFVSDLERSIPSFDRMVSSVRIEREDGDELVVTAWPPVVRVGTRFDVQLQEGWCWMQSRLYLVGMAAEPAGQRTRFAHLEGVPFRHTRVLRPVFRWVVADDVRGIARIVERGRG